MSRFQINQRVVLVPEYFFRASHSRVPRFSASLATEKIYVQSIETDGFITVRIGGIGGLEAKVEEWLFEPYVSLSIGDIVIYEERWVGTVICKEHEIYYGVDFGSSFRGHNLDERIETDTGYYIRDNDEGLKVWRKADIN